MNVKGLVLKSLQCRYQNNELVRVDKFMMYLFIGIGIHLLRTSTIYWSVITFHGTSTIAITIGWY